MRRIATDRQGERGAAAVIIAIMMVVLLSFAAISVDVAKLYSERAQLQNGADAAALMLAQKCAKKELDSDCSATSPLAAELADKNAVDGHSNVKSISLDVPGRNVKVTTGAKETGATTNSVSMFFAGILGFPSAEVSAASSVSWGSPTKGKSPFPITVSICQVRGQTDVMQLLQLHGKNANPGCSYGPSGATVPGGFGGLQEDASSCSAVVDINTSNAGGNTGNDPPKNCNETLHSWAADINVGKDVIVLLPVFNRVTGTGSTATYGLATIAAFKVHGWKLGATGLPYTFRNRYPEVPSASLECREPCRGIIGTFVEYVSLADGYSMGPVNPDGATKVEFSKTP